MRFKSARPWLALLVVGGVAFSTGCASSPIPPPIVSKAPLGSVIIYRNGVAYFERHLPAGEKELSLRVPAERVDDFLKSLTIIDDKTGETMPVSYPTMSNSGGDVEMTIALPKNHNGLRISYVTESPAWKPSYRLVLGKDGKAQLQGWAVVDNVSGEDWKRVRVGVGSTSALSFRYDLHSVREVERETLSSGSLVAVAPPTGGSPYASPGKGNAITTFHQSELDGLAALDTPVAAPQPSPGGDTAGLGGPTSDAWRATGKRTTAAPAKRPAPEPTTASGYGAGRGPGQAGLGGYRGHEQQRAQSVVMSLSQRLAANKNEKVRVEGFARDDDDDKRAASLERANTLRDALIANGVDPSQVEAYGTGMVDEEQGLRVVSLDETSTDKAEAGGQAAEGPVVAEAGQPQGQAHFVSSEAMTIKRDHSAMVSILNAQASAERVYFYDPISERGSDKFAFNAVRITNPSEYTLDSGPFTVYVEGQFLGEGLAEPILPHATAFIPYALDRNVIVEPVVTGREEISRLVTIQRGQVSTETRAIKSTKLVITNRGRETARIFVRHKVAPEHTLTTTGPKVLAPEKLGDAHLFEVQAPAGESVELLIEEWTPVDRTLDISSAHGIEQIGLYLKTAKIDGELKRQLEDIVRRHNDRAVMEERILTLVEQMNVYRARVDEINVQLVTLRKLPQGAKLRSHLAEKMEEISARLQEATITLADMKAALMTQRIELQDKLAELTLRQDDPDKVAKGGTP